ncbi:MAG: hypothetical protein L6437_15885 [Kiritimatiellae bacterium]|nr:hypothetical protein [Kiritimatiellia bacterium]
MEDLRTIYCSHIERMISIVPDAEDLIRGVLLNESFVEQVCLILSMKSDLTSEDRLYHNSIIGFPLSLEAPSFCVFEIGSTFSLADFKTYWAEHGFDSYRDYVGGILYVDGKGFDLYETQTGEAVPNPPTQEAIAGFLYGHILRVLEEQLLLMSVLWVPSTSEKGIMVLPPELL